MANYNVHQYYTITTAVLHRTPVLQSHTKLQASLRLNTTSILVCTAKFYSTCSIWLRCSSVYFFELQNTTPLLQSTTTVPLCITTNYTSTTLYFKARLHIFLTTKHCSSTAVYVIQSATAGLFYKELFRNYSKVKSTAPALLCISK